jgi:N-acetylglucosaminyldiphosphoundecaprenol N-acetyl-beta-D-mannosaminyltransferase
VTPLRILHVIGGGDTGGAMTYVLPLLSALRSQGCDANLLCLGDGGLARAAAERGLPVEVLPMSHPWDPTIVPALRHHLAFGEWHVVHSHGMRANLPVRLALPTVPGRPLLFTTVHSDLLLDYSHGLQSRGYAAIDRLTRPLVDAFCCVSADLARRLADSGVPRSQIYVVHAGIELSAPAVRCPQTPMMTPRGHVVGTLARLVEVKDVDLLLDTIAILAERVPDVRALIVGDGPERPRLEKETAKRGLAGRVEFPGHVRHVWPALAGLDVFVMTSRYEGLPISALEAMVMGLPVVATAVGGLTEVVDDGVTGFLVATGPDRSATAAALASRLVELLLDPALRERMGEAGRDRVAARFSSQVAGRKMAAIYGRELAGSDRVRASHAAAGWEGGWESVGSLAAPPHSVSVLGFRLDLVTLEEAARWVMEAAGRTGPTALAISFNPELVMAAMHDPDVAEVLRSADLAYPDGVGAVWAARRGLQPGPALDPGPQRVAGIDLAQKVLEAAAGADLPVYFLGAQPGVAEEAARRQCRALSGLHVVGHRDGYFSPEEEETVVAAVRASGAAILLVAMGAPRQETLLYRHREEWGAAVALGIGGSFDVWAGRTARAPDWVRRAGVEWLYRLAREPSRLRRQLVLPRYAFRVLTAPPQSPAGAPADAAAERREVTTTPQGEERP